MSNFLQGKQAVPAYVQSAPAPVADVEPDTDVDPQELVHERQEAFGAAFDTVNTIRGLGGAITEAGFDTDLGYRLDAEEELKDVPLQYQTLMGDILSDSRSAAHTKWLKERTLEELGNYETIQEYTGGNIMGSLGLMMAASVVDPVNAATLFAGIPLASLKTAERYGRVKSALKVAGFEASLNAALEAPLVAGNPTGTPDDILWAAMFGGSMGLGIGALAHKAPAGSLARKSADAQVRVSEDALDGMARAEAHTLANREADLDLQPPEDMLDIPTVRHATEAKATERVYHPVETLNARKAELEQRQTELAARDLPDEPVAPTAPDLLEGMVEELDFIKKVRSGEMQLSRIDRLNADKQFGEAKLEFLQNFREQDPDAYREVFGTSANPSAKVFEERVGAAEKAMAKMKKRHETEVEQYKKAIDRQGTLKDELLEEMDALELQLKAARSAKSVGAAEADVTGGIDLARVSEEEYDAMYNIPEMRQQRIPGTKALKEKFGKKDGKEKLGTATRWDIPGVLDRSVNQMVRQASRYLFQDAVPKVNHATNPESATELAEWIRDSAMGIYDSVSKPAYKAWLKEEGFASNVLARALDWDGKMRAAFEEEVFHAVKTGEHHSAHVRLAAAAQAKAYKRAFDYAVDSKLPGFEDLDYDPHYTPRRTSHSKIMHLNADYEISTEGLVTDSPLAEMYYRSIMEANPTFDPTLTARISNKIAKREMQRATQVDYDLPDFGLMTREKLNEMFDAVDITEVDRANFFASMDQQFAQPDAGRVAHAKKRMNLETNHQPIRAIYTGDSIPGGRQNGDTVDLTLEDMMETRGDILLQGYVNDLAGWGSLNRVTNGKVHNPSSLKKWKEEMVEWDQTFVGDASRFQNRGLKQQSAIQSELDYIDVGIRHTLGKSLTNPETFEAGSRRLLNGWNFLRVMNQTIFPQLSESSKIVTSTSLDTVMHYIPVVKDTFRALRAGEELSDSQMKLVLASREIGLGTNVHRGGVVTRHQTDIDGALFTKTDKWAARMAHIKKVTARPLQAGMDVQEVLASTSLQAELAMRAKGLKSIEKADMQRLAWMGINKSDLKAINKQIMKYATDERGRPYHSSDSKWMGNLHLEKWDDYKARDKIGYGLKRRVGEIIQTNNVGNLPRFALTDFGAIITQFRTFPLAAYNKQLMHHLAYNDVNAYMTFALNSAFASMFYAGQKYANSIGREDAQEYRDKALSPRNLAFAAWERSAWGSMTPMAGDVVSMLAQGQVMNPYSTRNTGLGKGVVGIPAIDVAQKTFKAFDSIFSDDASAKKAYKDTYALMPFYNFLGLQNVSNAIAARLPE